MYTKDDLLLHMKALGIDPKGTLLVHSSMKAIGQVEGGAETVLDALMEYMKDGLLILPTHTWDRVNAAHPVFDAAREASCVGILTNLFMKRPGVVRSLHPTHSVAAYGRDAEEYTSGEEKQTTPCHRSGCWGRLYDRKAKILFLGCRLTSNTYLHGVEEWNGIPGTLKETAEDYTVIAPDGTQHVVPQYRHAGGASVHYGKMEPVFGRHGALRYGRFGDARCVLCDAVGMADITKKCLENNPRLFRCGDLPEDGEKGIMISMYTKNDLMEHMAQMGIDPKGTLLVHSSMKAIGQVEGGAETVLDALMEYMKDGLLVLPTHTWDKINKDNPVMDAAKDGTCVGILTNLFLKRPGVIRSLHPTHSVAAFGREAEEYVRGEEKCTSPCPREGCWGKLYDRKAQILLLGVKLNRYTYIHSIEEWMDIPGRLTDGMEQLAVIAPSGERFETPQHRHMGLPSETFPKMDEIFRETGVMRLGRFGDAECRLCDAVRTAEVVMAYLKHNPELFSDDAPAERIAL